MLPGAGNTNSASNSSDQLKIPLQTNSMSITPSRKRLWDALAHSLDGSIIDDRLLPSHSPEALVLPLDTLCYQLSFPYIQCLYTRS